MCLVIRTNEMDRKPEPQTTLSVSVLKAFRGLGFRV